MRGSHRPSDTRAVAQQHIAVRGLRTEVRNRGARGQAVVVRTGPEPFGGSLGAEAGHMRRTQRREWTCGQSMASGPCPGAHRREFRMQPAVRVVDLSSPRRRQEGSVVGQADD